jgi:hypothetical protein
MNQDNLVNMGKTASSWRFFHQRHFLWAELGCLLEASKFTRALCENLLVPCQKIAVFKLIYNYRPIEVANSMKLIINIGKHYVVDLSLEEIQLPGR